MRTHLAGSAWILRVFFIAMLLPGVIIPNQITNAFFDGPNPPPQLLDLSSPVYLSEGAANGVAVWGDYDSDGDLDLLVNGLGNGEQPTSILWKNTAGVFEKATTNLPKVESASAAWGDYDNDGDLDLLILGQVALYYGQIQGLTQVYRNDAGTLNHLNTAVFPPLYRGWGDWGDYDNDGDLDLLLTGNVTGGGTYSGIYRNDGAGQFSDAGVTVPGAAFSRAAWGDYDTDGDLDFALIGLTATGPIARVYRQSFPPESGPQFNMALNLPGMWNGSVNWVDLDNDGFLDLALTGNTATGPGSTPSPKTRLLRYSSGAFAEIATNLPNVWSSSTSWGDFDNDGDPDLALNGLTTLEQITGIYRNDGATSFAPVGNLTRGFSLSVAWGNVDGDPNRALDLAVSGQENNGSYSTRIYRGLYVPANQPPSVPAHNAACWDPTTDRLLLDWSFASDDHTPYKGLTYALRVGTTPGGAQIVSPGSNLANGIRRLAQPGPQLTGSSAMLRGVIPQRYYWSVQAVDGAFTGGPFSPEGVIDAGVQIGVDDFALTIEESSVSVPVLANDNTTRGALVIESIQDPEHGSVVIDPRNPSAIVYTPDKNFFGIDRFYYHPRDPDYYCSRAYVEVQVVPLRPDPPTGVTLAPAAVLENQPAGTMVGKLTAQDPDGQYDSHTFAFVTGTGGQDNAMFALKNDWLVTREMFDYETRSTYSVRVRAMDHFGKSVDQVLAITILNTTESFPTLRLNSESLSEVTITISEDGVDAADQPDPFALTLTAVDADPSDRLFWSIRSQPEHGTAQVDINPTTSGQEMAVYYVPEADSISPDRFVVQVTDSGGLNDTIAVNVTVTPVNDPPRLDPLYDLALPEWQGLQMIPLSGLRGGGPDESEPVTIRLETDNPNLITALTLVEISPGVYGISFQVRGGTVPATITATFDDGQPNHNLTTRTFRIFPLSAGSKQYMPLLSKSP